MNPALGEEGLASTSAKIRSLIDANVTVADVEPWGLRRLAYQIEKKSEGFYAVVDLMAEPDTVLELDRQLNLNEAVLRTKVTRPEKH